MGTTAQSLLETGIYTITEASHLTRVSPGRIRRWLKGYEFQSRGGRRRSPAVWHGQLQPIDHSVALGFLDPSLEGGRAYDLFPQAGWTNLAFWDQANKFTKCFPALIREAERAERGSGFIVSVNGKIEPLR